MEQSSRRETGTLLLALITGLAINGVCAALFSALVPFQFSTTDAHTGGVLPTSALSQFCYAARDTGAGFSMFPAWDLVVQRDCAGGIPCNWV